MLAFIYTICPPVRCPQRVVQTGPRPRLSVVSAEARGRGLVTETPIQAGQFVCEYAGEVIGEWGSHLHWSIRVCTSIQSSDWLVESVSHVL